MDKIIQYINNSNKPIYVYGKSGTGKTTMLKNIPFSVKFISIQDIQSYEQLLVFSQPSIIEKMNSSKSLQVCIIDDVDYLQNNDKKILTSLLKHFKLEEKKKIKTKQLQAQNKIVTRKLFLIIKNNELTSEFPNPIPKYEYNVTPSIKIADVPVVDVTAIFLVSLNRLYIVFIKKVLLWLVPFHTREILLNNMKPVNSEQIRVVEFQLILNK